MANKNAIRTDPDRVAAVLEILFQELEARGFPYNLARLPQDFVPEGVKLNSLVHARFLFGVCFYMRGTIQSDYAIRRLAELFEAHPWMFDPGVVKDRDPSDVAGILEPYINYHTKLIARLWVESFKRLDEDWGGDPRNIFIGVTNEEEVYRRITVKQSRKELEEHTRPLDLRGRGFPGFREKMAGMLAYFLMDAGLIQYIAMSPPMDFHNLRVLMATGCIVVDGSARFRYSKRLVAAAVALLGKFCRDHGLDPVKLADATWLHSRYACARAIGNARGTAKIAWKPEEVRRYRDVCGACKLQAMCKFNIPAVTYYQKGFFELSVRQKPPLLFEHLPLHRRDGRKGNGNGGPKNGEADTGAQYMLFSESSEETDGQEEKQ